MVEVKVDGKRIIASAIEIHESVDMFVSEVKLTTQEVLPLLSEVKLSVKDGLTFVVLASDFIGEGYVYTLYPERYMALLNTIFPAFNGNKSTTELLKFMGVKTTKDSIKTNEELWRIPSVKWKTLIRILEEGTTPNAGAGAYLYVKFNGEVVVGDFKSDYEAKKTATIIGTLESANSSLEWLADTPGNLVLLKAGESGFHEKDFKFKENLSKACYNLVHQDESETFVERKFRNEFYKRWYRSQTVSLTNCMFTTIPFIGMKCLIQNIKVPYIVLEYAQSYNQGGEPITKVKLGAPPHE